jgi:hypothetical protein
MAKPIRAVIAVAIAIAMATTVRPGEELGQALQGAQRRYRQRVDLLGQVERHSGCPSLRQGERGYEPHAGIAVSVWFD